jgi:hypothetical protein
MDPYSEIQYAWTFARANRVADFQVKGEQEEASLETLESVFFTFKDPEFPGHGKTRSVLIPVPSKSFIKVPVRDSRPSAKSTSRRTP